MVDLSRADDGPRRLGAIATYLLSACAFSTLAISLLAPYLLRLVATSAYFEAYKVIPIIGAGYIFYSWTVIFDASFYITKRTGLKSVTLGLSCAVILVLYWVLIPRYGTMGAAWATLGGFAGFAWISGWFAQRQYRIQYEYGRIAAMLTIASAFYLAGAATDPNNWTIGLSLRVGVTLVFPVLLWMFASADERRSLLDFKNSIMKRFRGGSPASIAPDTIEVDDARP